MDRDTARVLVIDDDFDTAESTALLLRLDGYDAETAYAGTEAVTRALEHPPHVVLLNLGLPWVDGYSVARLLRGAGLPIQPALVAITGYGRPVDMERSAEAGFDLHLTKPVDSHVLTNIDLLIREVKRNEERLVWSRRKAAAGGAALLLAWIDMANTLLDVVRTTQNSDTAQRCVLKAMHAYERIKTRTLWLQLPAESVERIQEALTLLHERISQASPDSLPKRDSQA